MTVSRSFGDREVISQLDETTIKLAADNGHESTVCLLLQVPGINLSIQDMEDGHTAKSIALENGHYG